MHDIKTNSNFKQFPRTFFVSTITSSNIGILNFTVKKKKPFPKSEFLNNIKLSLLKGMIHSIEYMNTCNINKKMYIVNTSGTNSSIKYATWTIPLLNKLLAQTLTRESVLNQVEWKTTECKQ